MLKKEQFYDYDVYDEYGGYHGIYSEEVSSIPTYLWYYNWGYGGTYNGYYSSYVFNYNANSYNFNQGVQIITNIKPIVR